MNATWPADRFFWAVLEAPGWSRSAPMPLGLAGALADELPVDIDSVHAVATPMSGPNAGGRVLVCAARIAELNDLPDGTLSLAPDSVPTLGPEPVNPADLNLLSGAFKPRPLRRARARSHRCGALSLLLCAVIAATGLGRRAANWNALARHRHEATVRIAPDLPATDAEIVSLRARLQGTTGSASPPVDAAEDLALVLAGWPSVTACTTHSIAVGAHGASIAIQVEGDPSRFLQALRPPSGWSIDEPRLNSVRGGTRLSLRMTREPSP